MQEIALSPDGKNAYTASTFSHAIAVFDYDAASGAMVQKANPDACINRAPDGSGGTCRTGTMEWYTPVSVVVSPDGKNVYAVAAAQGVLVFDRDTTTGNLTQKPAPNACWSGFAACNATKGMPSGAQDLAISPDGKNVYATVGDTIITLDRNTTTGVLSQQTSGTNGCVSETPDGNGCAQGKALDDIVGVEVSPDGKGVYVTTNIDSNADDGIAIFDRNATTGQLTQSGCWTVTATAGCTQAPYLDVARALTFSPGGEHLYVAGDFHAILTFDRNTTTNALTQKPGAQGCLGPSGCAPGTAFYFPSGMDVSPDGRSLYVASSDFHAIAVFDRDPATGVIAQKAGLNGCISSHPDNGKYSWACEAGRRMRVPRDVEVHPNGNNVFAPSDIDDAFLSFSREDATPDDDGKDDDDGTGEKPNDTTNTSTGTTPPQTTTTAPIPANLLLTRPQAPPQPSTVRTVRVSSRPGNGTVDVEVTTNGAGTVTVTASAPVNVFRAPIASLAQKRKALTFARATKRVSRAGKVKLVLRPTAKAKRTLRRKGRLKATMRITFTPASGAKATTTARSVVFRMKRRR